ncbi:MAG: glycosyltransferase [Bacilli bacterium]|nr:glycosyltransferase [Bacilli bacterium]
MRVLFVFNHQAPYKVRLFNELSKEIEVTALFERLKDSDRDPRFYNCNDIKFKPTYIKGLNLGHDNHLSRGIVKHLMNNEYDIVVMNGWHTFSEMMAINHLKKHGKSYVFYINGGIINIKESRIMHKIKTHYISGASLYFSPDENSNKYLIHYGAEPEKIINYPYSTIYEKEILNNPLSSKEKLSIRESLKLDADKVFVSCGQFIPRKNYESLITYWKKQPASHLLVLIGGGPKEKKYRRLIKKLELTNVQIFDFQPRDVVFKYFQASDAYLFPSNEDIYGHVVNEALSQGLPVISNLNVNSAIHLIKNGENGYVINFKNSHEIDEAISKTLNTNSMPSEAIKTAHKNTIELMAKVHIDAFKEWTSNK